MLKGIRNTNGAPRKSYSDPPKSEALRTEFLSARNLKLGQAFQGIRYPMGFTSSWKFDRKYKTSMKDFSNKKFYFNIKWVGKFLLTVLG